MTVLDAVKNKHYKIKSIDGDEKIKRRLFDMGFAVGSEIKMVRIAPFGKTILVEVRRNRFAIRDEIAKNISVE